MRARTGLLALTMLVSAFLLFQVQPIVGKVLLPWFGGSQAVWTTCMLFFQSLLLGGYAYAHGLTRRLSPRGQAGLHGALLLTSLVLLGVAAVAWPAPLVPGPEWRPVDSASPGLRIVVLLTVTVGLPYFLLSSTGPLLQAWFARLRPGRSPYRLYALSNVGSLAALVSYPFVVEPHLGVTLQGRLWPAAYVLFAVGAGLVASWFARAAPPSEAEPVPHRDAEAVPEPRGTPDDDVDGRDTDGDAGGDRDHAPDAGPPRVGDRLLWMALAATPSLMLLAVTNQMTQDVAVVPFLWVLPLVLYLLSFILTFDGERWYRRDVFLSALAATTLLAVYALHEGNGLGIVTQIAVWSALLFSVSMVCHGELVRLKPHPRFLTGFYLMVSAGGALGGLLVGVVAPLLLSAHWELHAGLAAAWALTIFALIRDPGSILTVTDATLRRRVAWAALAGVVGLLVSQGVDETRGWLRIERNFYGVLHIEHHRHHGGLRLLHGRILHGFQHDDPERRLAPTTYYGPESGVGLAIAARRAAALEEDPDDPDALHLGVVGLGVGTVAAYGTPGDALRFYEINPTVVELARDDRYFSYLRDTEAEVRIVVGDGRLSLEREQREGLSPPFDVLAVDAFSGDAVPVHLLTREALALYVDRLAPGGIVALHVSNRHLDLIPVVARLADRAGLACRDVETDASREGVLTLASDWVLVARDETAFATEALDAHPACDPGGDPAPVWTDDFSDVLSTVLPWAD